MPHADGPPPPAPPGQQQDPGSPDGDQNDSGSDCIIDPPADCGGNGVRVEEECDCDCDEGYATDFEVRRGGSGGGGRASAAAQGRGQMEEDCLCGLKGGWAACKACSTCKRACKRVCKRATHPIGARPHAQNLLDIDWCVKEGNSTVGEGGGDGRDKDVGGDTTGEGGSSSGA